MFLKLNGFSLVYHFIDAMIEAQNSLRKEGEEGVEMLTNDHLSGIVFDVFNGIDF